MRVVLTGFGLITPLGDDVDATIILAGNIPGRTQTLATAIFSAQQAGRESEANVLLAIALVAGFAAVYATEVLSYRRAAPRR